MHLVVGLYSPLSEQDPDEPRSMTSTRMPSPTINARCRCTSSPANSLGYAFLLVPAPARRTTASLDG
jgi:hypothetical protein